MFGYLQWKLHVQTIVSKNVCLLSLTFKIISSDWLRRAQYWPYRIVLLVAILYSVTEKYSSIQFPWQHLGQEKVHLEIRSKHLKLLFKDPRSPEALCWSFVNNQLNMHFIYFGTWNIFETSPIIQKSHQKTWKLTNFFRMCLGNTPWSYTFYKHKAFLG